MFSKKLLSMGVAATLAMSCASVLAGPVIQNNAVDIVGAGAASDPLIAVEANRRAIIERLVAEHSDALAIAGISEEAFRSALKALRADQLLAARLVNTIVEISAIVSQDPPNGSALQRFVAMTPIEATSMAQLPSAEAFLVREGESLTIIKASRMQLGTPGVQFVGYFAPATTSVAVSSSTAAAFTRKDGPGTGPNSWIGYLAGGNVASGTGSAVFAGTSNVASGQSSFVGAGTFNAAAAQGSFVGGGTSNVAAGISSLVIGGFDNRATVIDALVVAGAGNRATGPRSVVVGGGYNLASGPWAFIGGGGRQTGSGGAGTSTQDNIASAQWSVVGGGVGNRATSDGAAVVGGGFNVASGMGSFIGGGSICCNNGETFSYPNVASGRGSVIGGGYLNETSGPETSIGGGFGNVAGPGFGAAVIGGEGNTASGSYATVGGYVNTASGFGSVALGQFALTETSGGSPTVHDNTFVFSDGSNQHFRSTAARTFNVLATGGVRFVTAATTASGEAIPSQGMFLDNTGMLEMGPNGHGDFGPKIGIDVTNNRIIGNQNGTMYFRSGNFAWFYAGDHRDNENDPGGGLVLATLTTGATTTTVTGTFRAQVGTFTSDRNQKTAFEALSPKNILAKVAAMPITLWSYKNEASSGVRHIGPVAQDFMRLFNVGYDDKSIATVDADGVAFAAIQGLNQKIDEKEARIETLERELAAIKAKLGLN